MRERFCCVASGAEGWEVGCAAGGASCVTAASFLLFFSALSGTLSLWVHGFIRCLAHGPRGPRRCPLLGRLLAGDVACCATTETASYLGAKCTCSGEHGSNGRLLPLSLMPEWPFSTGKDAKTRAHVATIMTAYPLPASTPIQEINENKFRPWRNGSHVRRRSCPIWNGGAACRMQNNLRGQMQGNLPSALVSRIVSKLLVLIIITYPHGSSFPVPINLQFFFLHAFESAVICCTRSASFLKSCS